MKNQLHNELRDYALNTTALLICFLPFIVAFLAIMVSIASYTGIWGDMMLVASILLYLPCQWASKLLWRD